MKPRILVIRGGAIGDFILTLPAIRLLREAFPAAELEIIGYQHIVALAEAGGYADRTRSIEYAPMAGFFARQGTLAEELTAYFAGFQQVVSYLFDPDGIFSANLQRAGVKNVLSAFRKLDDSAHATQQLALPLQSLALYLENPAPELSVTTEAKAEAAAKLPGVELSRVVAIHPGSGGSAKNWPAERWAGLGRRLVQERPGTELLLVGGEADVAPLSYLQEAWRDLPVHTAESWPLPQLGALLSQVRHYLGHDTGISHLAGAVGTPGLLLFGPTDPEIWAPVNPGIGVISAPDGDLTQLEEEPVWQALVAQLAPV